RMACAPPAPTSRNNRPATFRRIHHSLQYMAWVSVMSMLVSLLGLLSTPARGEETVRLRSAQNREEQRLTGEVIEYTGKELLIRRSTGREEQYGASRVITIESNWHETHREAEELLAQRRAADALPLLRKALELESRVWVQRRL